MHCFMACGFELNNIYTYIYIFSEKQSLIALLGIICIQYIFFFNIVVSYLRTKKRLFWSHLCYLDISKTFDYPKNIIIPQSMMFCLKLLYVLSLSSLSMKKRRKKDSTVFLKINWKIYLLISTVKYYWCPQNAKYFLVHYQKVFYSPP